LRVASQHKSHTVTVLERVEPGNILNLISEPLSEISKISNFPIFLIEHVATNHF